jgi:hypothetical protein
VVPLTECAAKSPAEIAKAAESMVRSNALVRLRLTWVAVSSVFTTSISSRRDVAEVFVQLVYKRLGWNTSGWARTQCDTTDTRDCRTKQGKPLVFPEVLSFMPPRENLVDH